MDAGYESYSPYVSMYDDPIRYSDPLGDEGGIWGWIKTAASNTRDFVAGVAAAVVDNNTMGLNNQRQAAGKDVTSRGIYNR